jgi:hypothetical protein
MLIAVLILLNIPVYFFIGWLVFDHPEDSAESFFESIVYILKQAFVPPFLQYVLWEGDDDYDPGHGFRMLGFFAACIAGTAAQWYLLTTYVWPA